MTKEMIAPAFAGRLESIDYDAIAMKSLFKAVEGKADKIILFDSFGLIPSSGTAMNCAAPVVAVYVALDAFVTEARIPLDMVISPLDANFVIREASGYVHINYPENAGIGIPDDTKTAFTRLAQQWKRDTSLLSRTDDMIAHPAYRKMIAMGMPVVPYILNDLESDGGYWFPALYEITHHNPIAAGKRCTLKELASAWIAWGRKNGHMA